MPLQGKPGVSDSEDASRAGPTTQPQRALETGISVLVVGAGVGGLVTALECWRKGHEVRIVERSVDLVMTGQHFDSKTQFSC